MNNSDLPILPQAHLVNILATTRDHHPNFALFLGAGASVSSGVQGTTTLIRDWRNRYCDAYGPGNDLNRFLRKQDWYEKENEYSVLFETLYDQPSQRREFVETCVKDAKPSWGYIYLVNLLRHRVFNSVFTTNFDDLLNEACYQFSSDLRPIVCAHDSSINGVRLSSKRPKIIKLHGDFLFDNIKNTVVELESLESNMKDKLRQSAQEVGLIVVGYGGNDRSVMDTLEMLLKQDSNFPHGIYWCVRNKTALSRRFMRMSRHPKMRLVEISGFDELFAELHNNMQLQLQPEVADPYRALAARLNDLLDKTPLDSLNKVISEDIKSIGQNIERFTPPRDHVIDATGRNSIPIRLHNSEYNIAIPYRLLSQISKRKGNYVEAYRLLRMQLDTNVSSGLLVEAGKLIVSAKLFDEFEQWKKLVINSLGTFENDPGALNEVVLPLLKAKEFLRAREVQEIIDLIIDRFSRSDSHLYHFLNKVQLKRYLGEALSEAEVSRLTQIGSGENDVSKMGALILLQNWSEAETLIVQLLVTEKLDAEDLQSWPIFDLLRPHAKVPVVLALLNGDQASILKLRQSLRDQTASLQAAAMDLKQKVDPDGYQATSLPQLAPRNGDSHESPH